MYNFIAKARSFGYVLNAIAWCCWIQRVVNVIGFLCFTNIAKPERDPSITGVPSVQNPARFSHVSLCFSK